MKALLAFLLTAAAITSGNVVKPSGENFELLILHNNDMHARFEQTSQLSGACTTADREAGKCYGGFARVAHVVKEARRKAQTGEGPPVLYLNAGDTYTGTAWFTIYKWKIAAEFINALQPDAVSLGNHEFDNGVNGLTPYIKNLTCPVLCANVDLKKVPELASLTNVKKSVVLEVAGKKIGIVGYLTPNTKNIIAVPNDVEFIDEIEALTKKVNALKDQGIGIIIALGHSGYEKDLEIAKEVNGIDLVIGGHSHTFLWNGTAPDLDQSRGPYPTYVLQASGKSVPVVQAFSFTKYLGKIHLLFDLDGEIIRLKGSPILLDNTIPQDPITMELTNKYRKRLENITEKVVGSTLVQLDGKGCINHECNLGNLITDAMVFRYAVDYKGSHWTDAPIAIIQAGGIRASLAHSKMPANITKGELLMIMPFGDILVTVTMNGTVLTDMIEFSISKFDKKVSFLQFSGIKVVYDVKRPAGSRLVEVKVRCSACDIPSYSKIIDKGIYKVIMSRFLAMGGSGFAMFKDLPKETLNYTQDLSSEYYISRHSPVYPEVEGRITFQSDHQHPAKINAYSSSSTIKLSLLLIFIVSFHL